MRLLALDQASHITGYAVFVDGKLEHYGKIKTDQAEIGDRLHTIREKVAELIADYGIDEIAFEDIQLQANIQNNIKTFKILAEVFGVVYELATELKIKNTAVLASVWKSTLGIKGANRAEQKRNAQIYVEQTYGLHVTQDETDAICIGTHILIKGDDGFDWS